MGKGTGWPFFEKASGMWTVLLDQETSRIIVETKHCCHLVGSGLSFSILVQRPVGARGHFSCLQLFVDMSGAVQLQLYRDVCGARGFVPSATKQT